VDRETEGEGSVIATIELDGRVVFTSEVLTGVSDPIEIAIPLGSAKEITLRVNPTPDGKKDDHFDWADARFTSP
jgi:hypothetical protein